jgi:hypothetical protein
MSKEKKNKNKKKKNLKKIKKRVRKYNIDGHYEGTFR